MPLGAFISSKEIMSALTHEPMLGHITTFGGHPLCCAAALANLKVLLEDKQLIDSVPAKEKLFKQLLVHPKIRAIRTKGLLIAVELESFQMNKKVIDRCIENGLIVDWFLLSNKCMRIAPPLIITEQQIKRACEVIMSCLDKM